MAIVLKLRCPHRVVISYIWLLSAWNVARLIWERLWVWNTYWISKTKEREYKLYQNNFLILITCWNNTWDILSQIKLIFTCLFLTWLLENFKLVACVISLLDDAVCANSCQGYESPSFRWLQMNGCGTSQAHWEDFSLWRGTCRLLFGIVSSQPSLGHTYKHFEIVKLLCGGTSLFFHLWADRIKPS